jgi:hypothetical protein
MSRELLMSNTINQAKSTDIKLGRLFLYLVGNIIGTYLLAAIFYADPFHFWEHAFSELGTTYTLLGSPNLTSSLIMTLGMFISGRLLLEIARSYRQDPSQPHAFAKSNLMYIASLGAFISIFPNNLFHTMHSYGSAFCIGSIFFFDLILLKEGLASHKPILIYLMIGLLSLSVFSYAIPYFLELPIKQATQKICIINLILILRQGAPQPSRLASPFVTHRPT